MTYEIKVNWINKNDDNLYKDSFLTNEVEFTRKEGLNAIKFKKEGAKRFTWVFIPNEYQMKKFYTKFEVIITEATTGRRMHTIEA